jgi:hypothetical protein
MKRATNRVSGPRFSVKILNGVLTRTLPGLLVLGLCLPAEAGTLYRYINDKGYQEIGYSIPPHLVANGYDVIDDSGRLIRRVAAQLSEEEYAVKLEQERKLEACHKAMDRVHRRYETLADIDAAQRLFEEQLEESLKNDQSNLAYSHTALTERQEQAASLERAGRPIPKHLIDNIERTEMQIQSLTTQIQGRERGRVEKATEFDEERRIFKLVDCNEDQLASAN